MNLLSLLPHTNEAQLLDNVIDCDTGTGKELMVAEMIMENHPHVFKGHFDGLPICPGHYLLEAAALTATLLYIAIKGSLDRIIILHRCDELKWPSIVTPSDKIVITASKPVFKRRAFICCDVSAVNQDGLDVFSGKIIGAFGTEIVNKDF